MTAPGRSVGKDTESVYAKIMPLRDAREDFGA